MVEPSKGDIPWPPARSYHCAVSLQDVFDKETQCDPRLLILLGRYEFSDIVDNWTYHLNSQKWKQVN